MARQASPHSAASVCRMTGRWPRLAKLRPIASHTHAEKRADEPTREGALFQDNVGFQQHVGLQHNFLAVRIDIGPIESSSDPVGWFLQSDRTGGVRSGENRLRHLRDVTTVGSEMLVRKSIVED